MQSYCTGVSDVKDNVATIRGPFVASENRDRQLFVLGWLKSSQSLTSNVAHPRAIRLHGASEVGMSLKKCLMTFTNRQ